jgi:nucleotide-binding universal stress UspA family protein
VTTIIVGVDGSEGAKAALEWACGIAAKIPGAKLVAVGAWQVPVTTASPWATAYEMPIDLTDATEAAVRDTIASVSGHHPGVSVTSRVVCGTPAKVLLDESRDADMLVVGSRGLGGFKGLLLGSVSHNLSHHVSCPLVIVPHPTQKD